MTPNVGRNDTDVVSPEYLYWNLTSLNGRYRRFNFNDN